MTPERSSDVLSPCGQVWVYILLTRRMLQISVQPVVVALSSCPSVHLSLSLYTTRLSAGFLRPSTSGRSTACGSVPLINLTITCTKIRSPVNLVMIKSVYFYWNSCPDDIIAVSVLQAPADSKLLWLLANVPLRCSGESHVGSVLLETGEEQ